MDAYRLHLKSELEQLKNDIANAEKQKQTIIKALEKKVSINIVFIIFSVINAATFCD